MTYTPQCEWEYVSTRIRKVAHA